MFKTITTTVPNNPLTVAGDVNGDGKADFLQISSDHTTVTVLIGNGDGTTTRGATLTPTGGALSEALGDVNGDGKLDLAIVNASGTGVTVMLGNGDGTFQTSAPSVVAPVSYVTLGDLNGDGRADLVTVSSTRVGVVRLSNTDGSFSSPVSTFSTPIRPPVEVGDVNGDGKADLVIRDYSQDSKAGYYYISFIPGHGDGSFADKYGGVDGLPRDFSIADLNADGRLDIVTVNGTSPSIFTNIGNGMFLNSYLGMAANSVQIGDIDGNGRPDLIFPESGSALLNFPSENTPGTISLSSTTLLSHEITLQAEVEDADGGIFSGSFSWQISDSDGKFVDIENANSPFYSPKTADDGHDLRVLARYVDGGLTIENPVSNNIHAVIFSSTEQHRLVATEANDFIVGYGNVSSLDPSVSNAAIFSTSVRLENKVAASGAIESATVVGPGGSDYLAHIGTFVFLDGDLSVDANGSAAIVTRLYEAAFGRDPDSIGLSHFTTVLDQGASLHDVASALTESQEFQSHEGALGNAEFVSAIYASVLYRTADPGETSYWQGLLDQGTSRADVLLGITQSDEAVGNTRTFLQSTPIFALNEHAAQVARIYDTAFGRDPDRAGLEAWRGFLDQGGPGHTLGDVANAFAGSPEFAARYGQSGTDAYVTALYQNALHRAPDDAGRTHWNAILDSGAETRAQVALDFSESAEHQNLLAPHIQDGIHLI